MEVVSVEHVNCRGIKRDPDNLTTETAFGPNETVPAMITVYRNDLRGIACPFYCGDITEMPQFRKQILVTRALCTASKPKDNNKFSAFPACVYSKREDAEKLKEKRFLEAFNTSINDFEISTRLEHIFGYFNILTIGDMLRRDERDFLRLKGIGRKYLDEIKGILSDISIKSGLHLELGMCK